ncbi:MBL fold metallo-hydrolase [Mesobacillus harenae]|uniref:MBL fold metallo-hydrolase n=1 Tax=Mesobacillus harenae TaxID=2213203 RepID=UPI00158093D2
MEWYQLPLGPLQTNCYIVSKSDGKCLIFDPGGEAEKAIQYITEKNLKPAAVILTHAHFDHIGAVDDLREHYTIPVYVHEKEAKWLLDPALNGSQFFRVGELIRIKPADHILAIEERLAVGGMEMEIYETPGHSPGSLSFYFPESGFVVAGDALFQGSIGRTDLPGGDHALLLQSIHDKLLSLPEETVVLPGHGPVTSIQHEMDANPFLNGF